MYCVADLRQCCIPWWTENHGKLWEFPFCLLTVRTGFCKTDPECARFCECLLGADTVNSNIGSFCPTKLCPRTATHTSAQPGAQNITVPQTSGGDDQPVLEPNQLYDFRLPDLAPTCWWNILHLIPNNNTQGARPFCWPKSRMAFRKWYLCQTTRWHTDITLVIGHYLKSSSKHARRVNRR